MKKIISLLIMCTLFVSVLVGCQKESSAHIIAKNLDKNLNSLSITVNKMDTIDNKYIANPDLYSSIGTPNQSKNKYYALTFKETDTQNNEINDLVKQLLVNKIKENLLNQNTTSSDNCYSCQKYCDNNGNCYYTDCNGNNYVCDSYGNCNTCSSIPSSCSYAGQTDFSSCPNATNISETTHEDLKVERLALEQNIQTQNVETTDNLDTINTDNTTDNATNNETTTDEIQDTVNETNETENDKNPNVRLFYFTKESFSPYQLKYQPRYVNQYNEDNINTQIEAYLFKVQKLYAMTEDSIEANSILSECKEHVIECIGEIRELNNCIINGSCEPSTQQLEALNNYIQDLKVTISRLKNCNGELTKEVNNINASNGSSIISSVDILNSRYIKLLNHIDTRITYHKSAIATLEQIKYLLDDTVNGNAVSEDEILQIVEQSDMSETDKQDIINIVSDIKNENLSLDNDNNDIVTNTDDIVNNNNDLVTTPPLDDNNPTEIDNNLKNKNIENFDENTQNEIVENENAKFENEKQDDFSQIFSDNNLEQNASEYQDNIDYNIDTEPVENQTNNLDESLSENIQEDYYTNSETSVENAIPGTDENVAETDFQDDSQTQTTETNHGNIDTYNYDTTIKNIDTYNDNLNNNANENYSNLDPENNNNTGLNDDSYNISNDIETPLYDNTNNEVLNDNTNFNTLDNFENTNGNYNYGNNVNNGNFHNSVITQNNLDTNNGNGGYYYTNDGEIKNNGLNNDNNIGNNGNSIETNLNGKNNVNTYGYNTMLDIINQGTVNNGINTL